jgi:phosphopantothenoylcysteine decarboxylase/phosphopantothenate--cysteine ligase
MQAVKMGAEVTLIMGPSDLKVENSNVLQINVKTAKDMQRSVKDHFEDADIAIFSAAVSDYKTENIASQKVKRLNGSWDISLTKTNDILLEISQEKKENQILVGFALETENELENAKEKLINKNLDMIVLNSLNDKGAGFGYDSNKITIIEKDNKIEEFELKHKRDVAKDIIRKIILKIS